MAELIDMRPAHWLDAARLDDYLVRALPGLTPPLAIRQYQGGQSNPTYLLTDAAHRRFVLRKKPPGDILPSAHAVEREFAVMRALATTGVPVPAVLHLCEDATVLGTPFYVMAHVDGDVMTDLKLSATPEKLRAAYYEAMADGLAALHRVDWHAAGLAGFGRPENYAARQVARWTRQYTASDPEPNPDMERLIAWLPEHLPPDPPPAIAHGDYRLGNLLFAPSAPTLAAILDWELATIGDPYADLAYVCTFYHLPHDAPDLRGLAGLDLASLGIPDEAAFLARYADAAGRPVPTGHWPFYLALSLFRSAAIGQGVFDRSRRGNAADERAPLFLTMVRTCAASGRRIVDAL